MSKVIDLTDFRVTESDNGESYVVLKKDFETIAEATHFESEIEKAAKILSEEMENACQMKVRLRADVNVGRTWYDAKG